MRPTLVASVCLAVLTACGGGNDTAGPGPGSTTTPPATSAAPSRPPVALSGTVNDRGSEDLGTGTTLEMDLGDSFFAPTYVKAAPGTKISIRLTNSGRLPHTFTVDRPKIDVSLSAGDEGAAAFDVPASGAVAFYCKIHRGQGMQGAFYVTPGATAAAASGGDGDGAYGQ